ncbi:MAG: hypothetical protein K2X35_15790 [Bryobacteraceae bacterium]|nr:hypothetical protein [Bryobacteraceae bacterium]
MNRCGSLAVAALLYLPPAPAQVDPGRAQEIFRQAQDLCERDAGRLWGISLCGPMVIADAATKTIATNRPAPDAPRPPALGFANAAMPWGGERWSTFVWRFLIGVPENNRGRLLMHELYHRIQAELGLMTRDGNNEHLDTLEGRYWLQLELRALAAAAGASGPERNRAVADALAFRAERRRIFPPAAVNEQLEEIREGLAQYTGTVTSTSSPAEAAASVREQVADITKSPSLVREFAYPLGAAYGVLLDAASPSWTRKLKATDDLAALLAGALRVTPSPSPETAAAAYGGSELRAAETERDRKQQARVAELRARFVEGPVIELPAGRNATFLSTGITSLPGHGAVIPQFRVTSEWGTLEAAWVLMSADRRSLFVPAPAAAVTGNPVQGEDWKLRTAPGWTLRPGSRKGDWKLVRDTEASAPPK